MEKSAVEEVILTELEKWQLINQSETFEDLKNSINKIGVIMSHNGTLNDSEKAYGRDAEKWVKGIDLIQRNLKMDFHQMPWYMLTRNYGIRQQAMYLYKYSKS